MDLSLYERLTRGATLITPNQRLTRELHKQFAQQSAKRDAVWLNADILPLNAWLERLWNAQRVCLTGSHIPRLLNETQARYIWQQIIRRSDYTDGMLEVDDLAELARRAWRLLHEWDLSLPFESYDLSVDQRAFQKWAQAYEDYCQTHHYLDQAALVKFLHKEYREGRGVYKEGQLIRYGFVELPNAQSNFFETLVQAGWRVEDAAGQRQHADETRLYCYQDEDQELLAAAHWAKQRLQADGHQQLAIIVPDLQARKAKIDEYFSRLFHPDYSVQFGYDRRLHQYNISLGDSLHKQAVIAITLSLLNISLNRLSAEGWREILLSPFVVDGMTANFKRASLDAQIYAQLPAQFSLEKLHSYLSNDQVVPDDALMQAIENVLTFVTSLPESALPSQWLKLFNDLLQLWGWPGERPLDSAEYQALVAWRELEAPMRSLDDLVGQCSRYQALSCFTKTLVSTIFQGQQGRQASVQILGVLEAIGIECDGLWVCALSDEHWPVRPEPTPLIPLLLQRQKGLPRSSIERETRFAHRVLKSLLTLSNDVTLSWAKQRGEQAIRPSPLLNSLALQAVEIEEVFVEYVAQAVFESSNLSSFRDVDGPVLTREHSKGGAGIFKAYAQCPFRSFAQYRLNLKMLERQETGLGARGRGILVHRLFENFWRRVSSLDEVEGYSEAQLKALVDKVANKTVNDMAVLYPFVFSPRFKALERRRLTALLQKVVEFEKKRASFSVVRLESDRKLTVGPLEVTLRADRIDRLEDGSLMVLDYKTGLPSIEDWYGERPNDPQLPLYSMAYEKDVRGLAFYLIRSNALKLLGISENNGKSHPGIKAREAHPTAKTFISWEEMNQTWREALETMAQAYAQGQAAVDPKQYPQSCRYCEYRFLCRVDTLLVQ